MAPGPAGYRLISALAALPHLEIAPLFPARGALRSPISGGNATANIFEIASSVPLDDLTVLSGHEAIQLYQWNTRVAKHYFCRICGIYTHHQRRSAPELFAINVACLDDQNLIRNIDIGTLNGAANSLVAEVNRSQD